MTIDEIRALNNAELLKLSLERGGKHNCYTSDALKAQKEWCNRKGNELNRASSCPLVKHDRSYYASHYY